MFQVGLARVRRTCWCGQGRVLFRAANRADTCDDCAPRRDQALVEAKVFAKRSTILRLRAATSCSAGSCTRRLVATWCQNPAATSEAQARCGTWPARSGAPGWIGVAALTAPVREGASDIGSMS